MDQLQEKLETLFRYVKKYHFWVFAVVIMLVGLGAWWTSTQKLSEEFDAFATRVKQAKQKLTTVHQTQFHPNERYIEGVEEMTAELRRDVAYVWHEKYRRQRENVLKWPDILSEDFQRSIATKKFGDVISVPFREQYHQYHVRTRFEQLPKIVKARLPEDEEEFVPVEDVVAADTIKNRREKLENQDYIVIWDDLKNILRQLDWANTPSSLKVWVTQEDLWVYEQLLRIIAATNQGATGPHNAAITRIRSLDIGKEASQATKTRGRLKYPDGDTGGSGAEESLGGGSGGGGGGGGGDQERNELLAQRYVDANGKPLPADADTTADEFKRIPIRMELVMDQLKIPDLIVECANAPLTVEIQQVRVNVRGLGGGDDEDAAVHQTGSTRREHLPVVLIGQIFIFNPPDYEKIGLSAEQVAEVTGASTEPANPAAAADSGKPAGVAEVTSVEAAAQDTATPAADPQASAGPDSGADPDSGAGADADTEPPAAAPAEPTTTETSAPSATAPATP